MTKAVYPLLLITSFGLSVRAQSTSPAPPPSAGAERPNVMFSTETQAVPAIAMPGAPMGGMTFISHEFSLHGGKPVAGSPYSAEQITEHVQTLADGNRIVNTTTTHLYRDSQGRTRTEVSFPNAGDSGDSGKMITIDDVIAGAVYNLQPGTKTAFKLPSPKIFEESGNKGRSEPITVTPFLPAPPPPPMADGAPPMMISTAARLPKADIKKDNLGTQEINGVSANGTRMTSTIPAGAIGNDNPIQVVSESWYSPELKMVVKSVQNDPRMGQTTVNLTNLNRTEPDPSLFQIPSDYAVSDEGPNVTFYQRHVSKDSQH